MVAYSKLRFIELLKRQKLDLTDLEREELNRYRLILDSQLDWEHKEEYLDLVEKVLSKKIAYNDFCSKFQEIYQADIDISLFLLKNHFILSPHENSDEFSREARKLQQNVIRPE